MAEFQKERKYTIAGGSTDAVDSPLLAWCKLFFFTVLLNCTIASLNCTGSCFILPLGDDCDSRVLFSCFILPLGDFHASWSKK